MPQKRKPMKIGIEMFTSGSRLDTFKKMDGGADCGALIRIRTIV
jgi:hypothetical protein